MYSINTTMSIYSLFNNIYDPTPLFGGRSVYVISDSELARYKRAQTESEITELERLIDGHKQSIERLETTVNKLRDSLALPEAEEPKAA
jgi:septal ring factor EnvC (AmiA/AmiB activator)